MLYLRNREEIQQTKDEMLEFVSSVTRIRCQLESDANCLAETTQSMTRILQKTNLGKLRLLNYEIECINAIINETFLIFDLHSKDDIRLVAIQEDSCFMEEGDGLESDVGEGSEC